jgi:hypothetical protein
MLLLLFGSLAHAASEVGGERDFGIGLSFGSQVEGISSSSTTPRWRTSW